MNTVVAVLLLLPTLFLAGCAEDPDTSAPQRTVIDRSADWQGALLYIADETGPDPLFGSIRVYDNVSGFVEKTVEQTAAASPVDVFVTRDGGSMYVASTVNGRIDKFRWDGNNWVRGGITIETPARSATALAQGPDGRLYLTGEPEDSASAIYQINTASDSLEGEPMRSASLSSLRGISWSPDGQTVYLTGAGPQGTSRLAAASWPSLAVRAQIDLPASGVSRPLATADGRYVYVMAAGNIFKIDAAAMAIAGTLAPSGSPATIYASGAFSADSRFLFVAGQAPGEASNLYVVDLSSGNVVNTVMHISDTASGMQRVE